MTFKEIMAALFSTSESTYYKWKKENRPIINLLSQYFSVKELEDFVTTSQITKFELIKELSVEELEAKLSNIGYYDRDQRVQEIILLLKKYSTKELLNALNYCFDKYEMTNRWNYDKYAIIEKIRNLLQDQSHNDLIIDFNEKIGFDFNINDIKAIEYLLMRFKVYNTLYEIEED